jgi:hypothetical protein
MQRLEIISNERVKGKGRFQQEYEHGGGRKTLKTEILTHFCSVCLHVLGVQEMCEGFA